MPQYKNDETLKYKLIYSAQVGGEYPGFGSELRGRAYLPEIMAYQSVLDVGCGHNELMKELRGIKMGGTYIGMDFVCHDADVEGDLMWTLPFGDKSFELVTAFDTLHHLTEQQIPNAIDELKRVAVHWMAIIRFEPHLVSDWDLNAAGWDEPTWFDVLQAESSQIVANGEFLMGVWK